MRLEWNERKGEREQMRAMGGQGLVGYRGASLLNEVGAMEGSGQRKDVPDPSVYRLHWLHWEEHGGEGGKSGSWETWVETPTLVQAEDDRHVAGFGPRSG